MRTLDRYLARYFAINVVLLCITLAAFVVGVDIFLNLKVFIRAAKEIAGADASSLRLAIQTCLNVIDLWGPRLLQLYSYIVGLVCVAAMGFTLASLVRRREIVAALAGGVSLHRIAMPFLVVTIGFQLIALANQELVLPRIAHLLPRSAGDTFKRDIDSFPVHLFRDGQNRKFYASSFDPVTERMEQVDIFERNEDSTLARRIHADAAQWDEASRAWILENATVESASSASAGTIESIQTDLAPTAILVRHLQGYAANLSWRQASDMLSSGVQIDPAMRHKIVRNMFAKPALATTNLLAFMIAISFFLTRQPVSMVVQSLKCAPIAIASMLGGALGAAAPPPGFPVEIGVFVPAMLLLPLAAAAMFGLRS
ncbi:MAG: LptF/LptG family permease [Planctomycetota bacterium]|jgi:lipopolysaccharide export system permease protein